MAGNMLAYLFDNYFMLFYFIALVLSLINYQRYYDTILRYFPIILAYTFLSEVLGLLVRDTNEIQLIYKQEFHNYNAIIFNIFDIIFFLYLFYIYYQVSGSTFTKAILKYGTWCFILVSIVNLFFQDFYTEPQNFSIIAGSVLLCYAALNFIIKLISVRHKLPLYNNLLFWISLGILFFYICYPIIMYILTFQYKQYIAYNLSEYHYVAIGVFYSCIIIGFILMKRLRIANEPV